MILSILLVRLSPRDIERWFYPWKDWLTCFTSPTKPSGPSVCDSLETPPAALAEELWAGTWTVPAIPAFESEFLLYKGPRPWGCPVPACECSPVSMAERLPSPIRSDEVLAFSFCSSEFFVMLTLRLLLDVFCSFLALEGTAPDLGAAALALCGPSIWLKTYCTLSFCVMPPAWPAPARCY